LIHCIRPGTKEFLQKVSEQFEMHIYTMGTRNYAEAIANVIDPDKSLFKERILSRDESGSFAIKSIQRLFPCDQSMVVVVDDRSDIWRWSPNLIKVKPCKYLSFRLTKKMIFLLVQETLMVQCMPITMLLQIPSNHI
jgi:RNA polymerase II subunit A-like phosphatase